MVRECRYEETIIAYAGGTGLRISRKSNPESSQADWVEHLTYDCTRSAGAEFELNTSLTIKMIEPPEKAGISIQEKQKNENQFRDGIGKKARIFIFFLLLVAIPILKGVVTLLYFLH